MKRKSKSQIEYHFVTITPADAQLMLDTLDGRQRTLKPSHISYLGKQLVNKEWNPETGEPIKISKGGKLIDGQHRCAAIVATGISMKAHIAYGVPDEVYGTLDTGLSRSPMDQVRALGVKHASSIAAMIRAIAWLKTRWAGKTAIVRLSARELEGIYEEYKAEILDVMDSTHGWRTFGFLKPLPVFRAVFVLAMRDAEEETREFFKQVGSGENLTKGDPALTFRTWLTLRFAKQTLGGGGKDREIVTRVLVSTLNAHYAGRKLQKISYKTLQTPQLKFPKKQKPQEPTLPFLRGQVG